MPQYTQNNKIMRVKFAQLGDDDLLLAALSGTEAISELYHFRLDLLSPTFTSGFAPYEQIIGSNVCITFPLPAGGSRYIHGIVRQFERGMPVQGPDGSVTFIRYYAEVVPRHWLLTKRAQTRVFYQQSAADIVKAVLAGMPNLNVDSQNLGNTYPTRDHCVQYQESDFAFASRLMEEEGIYYYFKHEEDKHTLVLGDSAAGHVNIVTPATVRLEASESVNYAEDTVRDWRKSQGIASGKYTSWDYWFADAKKNQGSSAQLSAAPIKVGQDNHTLVLAGNTDDCTLFEYPAGYSAHYDPSAPSVATILSGEKARVPPLRLQAEAAASLECRGKGTCRHFTAGCKFELDAGLIFPRSMAGYSGEYVLTRIEHQASVESNYLGGKPEFGPMPYRNSFSCLPVALPYRPSRRTPRPIIPGLQTGVVVGTDNTDADPDCSFRVRVQFFWDPAGQNALKNQKGDKLLPLAYWANQTPSTYIGCCWARVAQSWADRKFGTQFVPRLGQEVVVGFLDGDPDRPLVVGCVYNDINQPPFPLPDNKLISGIKTHTAGAADTLFSGIAFDDTPSKETMVLQSQGKLVFNVKSSMVLNINGDFTINLAGNQKVNQGSFPTS